MSSRIAVFVLTCTGIVGCGGSNGTSDGTPGGFYSCDNLQTSTGSNGDVAVTEFCEEFTIQASDPMVLRNGATVLAQSCQETLLSHRYNAANFATTPCPTDASLFATCVDPMSNGTITVKDFHYFIKQNGVAQVTPVIVEPGCTAVRD
jgi:hypothetical protein